MQKQRQREPEGNECGIYRDYGQSLIAYRLGNWIFGLYLPKSPRSGSYEFHVEESICGCGVCMHITICTSRKWTLIEQKNQLSLQRD